MSYTGIDEINRKYSAFPDGVIQGINGNAHSHRNMLRYAHMS